MYLLFPFLARTSILNISILREPAFEPAFAFAAVFIISEIELAPD